VHAADGGGVSYLPGRPVIMCRDEGYWTPCGIPSARAWRDWPSDAALVDEPVPRGELAPGMHMMRKMTRCESPSEHEFRGSRARGEPTV
jgi:hypothetical protein